MYIPIEFLRIKYEVVAVNAELGRKAWKAAQVRLDEINKNWSKFKSKAKKIDSRTLNRMEFCLMDLERAVYENKAEIATTIGKELLDNLREIEDIFAGKTVSPLYETYVEHKEAI